LISVSIVSHKQSQLILALLEDIKRLSPPEIAQIIIVHNDGDDSSAFPSRLGNIPIVQVVNSLKRGFGANHNAAFKVATQPYFAVLNPDLRLPNNPFPELLRCFNDAKLGLAAPQILNPDLTVASSSRRLYSPLEILKGALGDNNADAEPDWLAGMFLLFRRQAFESVRGFDERYFMYVEDVDICARTVLAGWTLRYEPAAAVIHDAQRANRKSAQHLLWHLKSAIRWWCTPVFWRYRHFLIAKSQSLNKNTV
jgi:N-acetylglucosaminyl-diphospho-decaprenol L-rhamnosyltransferase